MKRLVGLMVLLGVASMLFGQTPMARTAQERAPEVSNSGIALEQCQDLLKKEIEIARQYSGYVEQQVHSGIVSVLDTYLAQFQVAELEGEWAALNGGLVPRLPVVPLTKETVAARQQYRASLQTQIDLLQKNSDATAEKYQLGTGGRVETARAQLRLLDLRLEQAAYDAGLSLPARARMWPKLTSEVSESAER